MIRSPFDEWLLFNAKWARFQPYHGENKLYQGDDNDDNVRFVLDQYAEMDFYSANSLKQQSADRYVAPLGTLFWFWANQSLLFLLNTVCLAEKQQIPIV